MFTLKQLKTISQTPDESEISLKLLAEFYELYISNRIYELEMDDETMLIFSTENHHFPHLIGLQKFVDKGKKHRNRLLHFTKQVKAKQGFDNIKKSRITLEDLKCVDGNTKRYNSYKKRILNFPFTYQLLRESVFLSYDKEKVGKKTLINGDYIFVNDIGKDKLHFFFINSTEDFIDGEEYGKDDSVVPITFIVTKNNDFNFVGKQGILRIRKITIKDFTDQEVLEEYDFTKINEIVVKS